MKKNFLKGVAGTLVLVGLPFVVGSIQSPKDGLPTEEGDFASTPAESSPPDAELTSNQEVEAEVGEAGGPAIALKPPVAEVRLSVPAAEVVKLAQSGVNEDVLMAYVANAGSTFNLGSDQIIYLNDIGVSGEVVKAMIQRDTTLNVAAGQAASNVPTVEAPIPPSQTNDNSAVYPPTEVAEQPLPMEPYDPGYAGDVGNSDAYFYDSLRPYGSWVYLSGYGRCWQPTVCVGNRDWRPYCDQGRWLNTDSGWYWQSNYSWGWAPFHYGRWFCDDRRGWVWCPGRTWAPAWVSWRRSSDYCGWAPLPPAAHFIPGSGFHYWNHSVGVSFEFGLRASHYTFLPVNRFCDPTPWRHRVASTQVNSVYNHTTVINNVTVRNNTIINQGIDPRLVAAASHTKVHTTVIQEISRNGAATGRPDRLNQSGNKLLVYRPHLPATVSTTRGGSGVAGRTSGAVSGGTALGNTRSPAGPHNVPKTADPSAKAFNDARNSFAPQGPKQIGASSKFNGAREPVRANTIVPVFTRKDPVVNGNAPASITKSTSVTPGVTRPQTVSTTAAAPVHSSVAANLPVKDSPHTPTLPALPTTVTPGAGMNKFKSGNEVLPPNSLVWTGKKPTTTLQPGAPTPAPVKATYDKPTALPPIPTSSSKPTVNYIAPTTPIGHAPAGWIQPIKPYSSYTPGKTAFNATPSAATALPAKPTPNVNSQRYPAQTPSYKPGAGFQPLNQPGHSAVTPAAVTQNPFARQTPERFAPAAQSPRATGTWPQSGFGNRTSERVAAPSQIQRSTPSVSSPASGGFSQRGSSQPKAQSAAPQTSRAAASVAQSARSQPSESRPAASYSAPASRSSGASSSGNGSSKSKDR